MVLAIGVPGTTLLTWGSVRQSFGDHGRRENPVAEIVVAALDRKLSNTEAVLQGLVGLQMASEEVTPAALRRPAGPSPPCRCAT
ncbi:hypothetical protein H6G65_06810 [Microcystis elabens FACHB-917]|nr:hypothetical protein [Microcystis elabens FACHB-917]